MEMFRRKTGSGTAGAISIRVARAVTAAESESSREKVAFAREIKRLGMFLSREKVAKRRRWTAPSPSGNERADLPRETLGFSLARISTFGACAAKPPKTFCFYLFLLNDMLCVLVG